jgi:tripartite-type tricarboxylate transporter receptor subunit TctC
VQSHIADKTVTPASSGLVRTGFLADFPAVKEAGGGDFETRSWNAIFAPKGTPPDVIKTLNTALVRCSTCRAEETRARSRHRGQREHAGGNPGTAERRYRQMG